MNAKRSHWRRATHRLLVVVLLAAAASLAASAPARAATTASFSTGVLTVFGDAANNSITISRDAAGKILVNGGAVAVTGGSPTVANTTLIQVFGQAGNDSISLNEANGALPKANLFGGPNNDTLTGGSGADAIFGQAGNDTLLGRGGVDILTGGTENDTLTGGDADDQVFGQAGNDRMVWNPGDDTDLDEGADGTDTVEVNGGNGTEQFTVTANGTRVRFDRLDPAPFSIDIGASEKLVLNANGGDDKFSATGNLAALIQITVDGGTGSDTILGSNGVDLLLGGDDNDFVDGQQGNDTALLGAGDDLFQWDPGDGSDTLEGQSGSDRMVFNGSAAAETFESAANGGRTRFTRNVGAIVMDLDDVESIGVNALGNTDTAIIGDMTATDVARIDVDQSGTLGGATGDGQADAVVVNGTNGPDLADVFGAGTSASVLGLATQVNIANAEGANDALTVSALGGNDRVTATTLPADVIKLTIDGGAGDDQLLGSQGGDTIVAGGDDDVVVGDNGNDLGRLGAGDDTFQWSPGDGNDTIEGQEGSDSMLFFGANIGENIDILANGGRVLFVRNIANVTMDLDDVETVDLRALGGADNIVVGDLSATDLTRAALDLGGADGGGDGATDAITVNGTQGNDLFGAAATAGAINVVGLKTAVDVVSQEPASDRLTLNGLAGGDTVDATSLPAGGIQLTMNGGLGTDTLLGSEGDDLVTGGDGDDVASLAAGDDTFVWNPGDDNDTLEGQSGFDEMLFNGANVAENIDVSANGERVRFARDIASVIIDLNDIEKIDFAALGGADTIVANDLSGTDVSELNTALAAGGAGDAQPDNVIVNGTNGDDVTVVAGDASGVAAFGLAARVNVTGAEAANDRLTVNMLPGDDVVDATAVAAGSIQLTLDGGAGNDVLIGGDGNDVIWGGLGDDVLIGGPGVDTLDGGGDDDIVIELAGADPVTSAAVADKAWLKKNARIVDGRTVLDVRGKQRTLPRADLSQLVRDV